MARVVSGDVTYAEVVKRPGLAVVAPREGLGRRRQYLTIAPRSVSDSIRRVSSTRSNVSTDSDYSTTSTDESFSSLPSTPEDEMHPSDVFIHEPLFPDEKEQKDATLFKSEILQPRKMIQQYLTKISTVDIDRKNNGALSTGSVRSPATPLGNLSRYVPHTHSPHVRFAHQSPLSAHEGARRTGARQGRKKALCIGINYKGQAGISLRGCINDAERMRQFLITYGNYEEQNITLLTDGGTEAVLPTKANILDAMRELVKDALPGDTFFLHFSGHGQQVPDQNGDESDKFDEALYPLDFAESGPIIDDDVNEMLVMHLPEGSRLTALIDSCHSGTALDLPYNYFCDGVNDGMKKCSEKIITIQARVVSWSGCKDYEKSEEILRKNGSFGLMCDAFISCLEKNPHQTYRELWHGIQERLSQGSYKQRPQLGASHDFEGNIPFIF